MEPQMDEDMERVKRVCESLGEHYDSVQIFCTRVSDDRGTVNCCYGSGNWFARFGFVKAWLLRHEGMEMRALQDEDGIQRF